jgi:Mn-dependent DtxR family transcriptional regulator
MIIRPNKKKEEIKLTKRQTEFLVYIYRFINYNGYSPSYDEIANGMSVVRETVMYICTKLIDADCITKKFHSPRSILLTSKGEQLCQSIPPTHLTTQPLTMIP